MTDPTGVVYDLGYKPHEGPRLGRAGAIRAVVRDGVRRILGLRRKARRKILPFMLLGLALLPAVAGVGLAFLTSQVDIGEAEFFTFANYFDWAVVFTLLFVALASSELLVPDRVEGMMAIYASRPLRVADYLAARAAALGITVTGFLLVPQAVLYVGLAAVSPDGFFSALIDDADRLPRIALAAVGYFVAYSSIAFLIAAFSNRTAVAAGVYLAVMIASLPVAAALIESNIPGRRYAALLALYDHPAVIKNWLFGTPRGEIVGPRFDPWVSALVIAGLAVVAAVAVHRRYRRAAS